MTPAERQDPKLLNGSRRARIAKGSGTQVQEVNSLMERFTQAQIMMKQMGKGGMPVMPGMPGFGMGGGKKSKGKMPKQQKVAKGAQGRSGNPAKRVTGEQTQGVAQEMAPPNLGSLPPDLKKMLGQ
jgi:signal recognition particle subunit SRP54